ncbi:polysaccharide pyruvyl transferase family protein [Enterococcus avium]|uniref:polysaccharide pyruvyl transferase family protein n=1 Tax=Enterococcus avium TaxID=33945 RepID=UPI00289148EA|nr:polysaccharide pyruvyl transferase family protein [Enterococcus avium]MDT2391070.1 polysaccharide pyruvyl transferase family protein [Enterococcus avium]
MKRIGIATFNRTHNYGSLLQSYALQKVLETRYDSKVEFINFSNDEQREMYAYLNRINSIKNIVKNSIILMNKTITKTHFEDFNDFQSKHLHSSLGDFHTENEVKDLNYDIVISGSDQVWNTKARDFDDFYFLGFLKNIRKVAYACSLGGTNFVTSIENPNKYLNLLNQYSAISVRERNSQQWLDSELDKKIEIMPDPTLLIDKEGYSDIDLFDKEKIFKGDYIHYYGFKYDHSINMKVKELGEKLGLPVVVVDGRKYALYNLKKYGFKVSPHGGPSAFINLMKNCTVSVTQSFHGTIFSMIFEKPFFYMRVPNVSSDDDRASFLLEQTGLLDQSKPFTKIVEESDDLFGINYPSVKNRIKEMQSRADTFIREKIID